MNSGDLFSLLGGIGNRNIKRFANAPVTVRSFLIRVFELDELHNVIPTI
jgi:hypothetical protein